MPLLPTCHSVCSAIFLLLAPPCLLSCLTCAPRPSICPVMPLHLSRHTALPAWSCPSTCLATPFLLPRLTPSPYTSAVLSIYILWPAFISALCGTLSKVAGRGRGGRQRVNHTAGTPRLCTETDQQGTRLLGKSSSRNGVAAAGASSLARAGSDVIIFIWV